MTINLAIPKNILEATQEATEKHSYSIEDLVDKKYLECYQNEFLRLRVISKHLFSFYRETFKGVIPEYDSTIYLTNKHLNRYSTVIPYDKNYVSISGKYINASYIELANSKYIATQAPLPHTFIEYWNMIWENKCNTVVMLANLLEHNKVKAHCYWPKEIDETLIFGDIAITLTQIVENNICGLEKRIFVLTKNKESYNLSHYHYKGWPDYGVANPEDFISLIKDVNSLKHTGPMVVHCSAGIGRAGTFIATYSLVQDHAKGCFVMSVAKRVLELRDQRRGMVQTDGQYHLIYQGLSDYLSNI